MAPKTNTAKLVAKLEQLVLQQERQVELLTAQRRELLARATAAQAAVQQCEALLQLSHAISSSKRGGGGGGGDVGGGRAACPGAAAAAAGPSCEAPGWQGELRGVIRDMAEGGGGAPLPSGADGACEGAPLVPALDLGWTLEGAVEMYKAGADLTGTGLLRVLSETIKSSSFLLPHIRSGAPDAEAAARQLCANNQRLRAFVALLAVHSTASQSALSEVVLSRIDAVDAPGGGSAEGPQERPSDEQIRWAISQLHLEPCQEDPVIALLSLAKSRLAAVIARREALLQRLRDEPRGGAAVLRAGAPAADVGAEHEETVRDLHSAQAMCQILTAVFLAAFSSLVRHEQLWAMMVAAYPFVLSLNSLHTTLLEARLEALERARNEPQKRRRGRPRKNPLPEPELPIDALLKEATAAAAEAAEAAEAVAEAAAGGSEGGGGGRDGAARGAGSGGGELGSEEAEDAPGSE